MSKQVEKVVIGKYSPKNALVVAEEKETGAGSYSDSNIEGRALKASENHDVKYNGLRPEGLGLSQAQIQVRKGEVLTILWELEGNFILS